MHFKCYYQVHDFFVICYLLALNLASVTVSTLSSVLKVFFPIFVEGIYKYPATSDV